MSREVAGTPPRQPSQAGRARRLGAAGLVALAVGGAAIGLQSRDSAGTRGAARAGAVAPTALAPGDPRAVGPTRTGSTGSTGLTGLTGEVLAAGPVAGDLASVPVVLVVRNGGRRQWTLTGLALVGLGEAFVADPGQAPIPAGGVLRVPATVTADCGALRRRSVHLIVSGHAVDGTLLDEAAPVADLDVALATLSPLCPPTRPGLAVRVTASRVDADGSLVVRIVNDGGLAALVVPVVGPDARGVSVATDPGQPFALAPGDSLVTRLRLVVTCPAPPMATAAEIGLEARMPEGYAAVTGWPAAPVRAALQAARRRCG